MIHKTCLRACLKTVASAILADVEPGLPARRKECGEDEGSGEYERSAPRRDFSGRQDATLYGRPGGPPLFFKRVLTLTLAILPLVAHAKLNVVATLPDFGAIAQEIGGDKVKVTTIAKGTEDAHFVDARPSFIRVLNQADVLIEGGAELEIGWLPPLVNNARNSKILADAPGHLVLSRGIRLLDVPTGPIDRSMGDVHPLGNPHYWLDPSNGQIMASSIAETFSKVDPANTAYYQANLKTFSEKLARKLIQWDEQMKPYQGTKVVTYHKSFDYFLDHFGLVLTGTIEPKPGVEPSPTHVNSLIPRMKQEGVKLIIVEPFRPRKTPEYIAEATGAKLLLLPDKVGGNDKVVDYFSLFDYDVSQIVSALKP
jgi:zinc/manganese transport system substrate-binding protein